MLKRHMAWGAALIAALGSAGGALAQETSSPATAENLELGEILVTAERRESTTQRTAASIAVISGETLNEHGLVSMDEALRGVAGLVVQGQAKGFTPAIRGLGTDLPPGSSEGSVATNFDGAYNIRSEAGAAGFFDIGRIEILRGPQGTLYGRNATAGVVNVISNNPILNEYSGAATVEVGSYDLFRAELVANLPIGENLALRAAMTGVQRDGYLSNGLDDNVSEGARFKLLYEPNDATSILVGAEYIHLGGRGASGVPAWPDDDAPSDPWETPAEVIGFFGPIDTSDTARDFEYQKIWAQLDLDLGFGTLTVLPAYSRADQSEHGCFEANCTNSAGDPEDLDQFSGEVRLVSPDSSPVRWAIGYYHYDYSQLTVVDAINPAPELSTNQSDANSDAVFAQVTAPLSDTFRITGGLRQTYDQKERLTSTNLPFPMTVSGTGEWDRLDGRLGFEFDVAPRSMLYASVSTGYRPGGFNPDGSTFEPETVTAYEVGSHNLFWDNRVQLNANVYFYDYLNYQAFDFIILPPPQFVFYNVDSIDNYGAELDARVRLTSRDTLGLSAAYLHAEFTSDVFISVDGPFNPPTNFNGSPLPHSPQWTINGDYEHVFELAGGELSARANIHYVSGQYTGPHLIPLSYQPEVVTGDLFATFTPAGDAWSVTAYVRNVSDEPIKTNYIAGYNTVAAPRTYGLVLSARFGAH